MSYNSTKNRNRSKLTLVSQPASEPVSLAEARRQINWADTDTTHDNELTLLIGAARNQWEDDTDTGLINRTYSFGMWGFPTCGNSFSLLRRPVSSITSIQYYDTDNAQQTLSTSIYSLDAASGLVYLQYDQSWPDTVSRWDAVTVTYVVGYGSAASSVPAIAKQAMLLLIAHYFENRDMLMSDAMTSMKAYRALVRQYMRSSYP